MNVIFKKLFFIMLLFMPYSLFSQTIAAFSINPAGGFVNSNGLIDFTVGQNVQQFSSNAAAINSSIFMQFAKKGISPKPSKDNNIEFLVTIYPNPVVDFANIIVTACFKIEKINIKIFDENGELFFSTQKNVQIADYFRIVADLTNASSGIYIVNVAINGSVFKSYKIVKS